MAQQYCRWYLCRREQSLSGGWFLKPTVVLPRDTHLQYFPGPDPSYALVRIVHEDESMLDSIESNPDLQPINKRLERGRLWQDIKDADKESILTGLGVDVTKLRRVISEPDRPADTTDEIIKAIVARYGKPSDEEAYVKQLLVIRQ